MQTDPTTVAGLLVVVLVAGAAAPAAVAAHGPQVRLSVDAPESVDHGDAIAVRTTVENTKPYPVTKVVTVEGPTTTKRKQVRLPSVGERSLTTLLPTEEAGPGTHEITVHAGMVTKTVTVEVEGNSLPPTLRRIEVPSGQRTAIDLSIGLDTDRIVVSGTHAPALATAVEGVSEGDLVVETGTNASTTVAIAAADRPTLTVSVAPDVEPGTTLRMSWVASNGSAAQAIAVEVAVVEADPVATYRGPDGTVGTDGLRAAIDDWARGAIDLATLREVIRAWARS